VVIGDRLQGAGVRVPARRRELGNDVFIGPHVCFTNDPVPPSKVWAPTLVGDGAVDRRGAVIKAGVRIAAGAKIGCGAVVVKDVPADGTWWAGNPARPL
jgi:UDP-2-acetamido-3-amino-2,3-dideoxy-glucuronate N-acetyltransferase